VPRRFIGFTVRLDRYVHRTFPVSPGGTGFDEISTLVFGPADWPFHVAGNATGMSWSVLCLVLVCPPGFRRKYLAPEIVSGLSRVTGFVLCLGRQQLRVRVRFAASLPLRQPATALQARRLRRAGRHSGRRSTPPFVLFAFARGFKRLLCLSCAGDLLNPVDSRRRAEPERLP